MRALDAAGNCFLVPKSLSFGFSTRIFNAMWTAVLRCSVLPTPERGGSHDHDFGLDDVVLLFLFSDPKIMDTGCKMSPCFWP